MDKIHDDTHFLCEAVDSNCKLERESDCGNYRLYIEHKENGFNAKLLSFVATYESEAWTNKTECRIDFEFVCYFDGVRHIWCDQKNDGYIYYPDMNELCIVFKIVNDKANEIINGVEG